MARAFSLMKSTPSTTICSQPFSTIPIAASAIARESLMCTCGQEHALSTPWSSGSM